MQVERYRKLIAAMVSNLDAFTYCLITVTYTTLVSQIKYLNFDITYSQNSKAISLHRSHI